MPQISFEQVSKYYYDQKSKLAIAGLYQTNLILPDKSFAIITGPSGCGKSTLLKLIAGLLIPEEGKIYFDSRDVTEIPPKKRNVSLLSQEYVLYPSMTVFENIAFPLKNEKIPPDEIRERIHELASMLDLMLLLSRKPKVLSGGQKQRVALAKALVKHPEVVLLDEPLSNQDDQWQHKFIHWMKQLQQQRNINVIYVTHQIKEFSAIADFVVLMDNGEVKNVVRKTEFKS